MQFSNLALPAPIRFLPSVICHMILRVLLHESLVTLLASVWSLPIVSHHMIFKIALA